MYKTNLRKVDESVMLEVPPAILTALHLRAGIMVSMEVADGRLVVNPKPRPRYKLTELLAEASDAYPLPAEEREWIDAPPVGTEVI